MADVAPTEAADPRPPPACRICGGHDLGVLKAREMMFGRRQRFQYRECRSCGCVQIAEYPPDIAEYYGDRYYSYRIDAEDAAPPRGPFAKRAASFARRMLIRSVPGIRPLWLRTRATRRWLQSRPLVALYLRHVRDPRARILDVGCGGGALLRDLMRVHYTNVRGIDPFIAGDVHHNGRVLVRKASLQELRPAFDCIAFHHVLEHMPDQLATLRTARALLAPGGILIVRIPIVGGLAWRTYRENWVQLDPPRHFYLHSPASFTLLAAQAGFDIVALDHDSFGLQFWGSELYCRDIPLMDPRSPATPGASVFSAAALADYEAHAAELNRSRDGDQIVAILRR
jgi:SAM-dependent methyltransferase